MLVLKPLLNKPLFGNLLKKNLPLFSFFASSVIATTRHLSLPTPVTEAAWTIFLQSSLILGIWSKYDQFQSQSMQSFLQSNLSILMAFIIGSMGSFLGGIFGYSVSSYFVQSTAIAGANTATTLLKLKMIASCITASYIGGTANFFETSEHLTSMYKSSMDIKKSLNAVAGIDIGIMVAYFSLITSIQTLYSRYQRKSPVSYAKSRKQYIPPSSKYSSSPSVSSTGNNKSEGNDQSILTEPLMPVIPPAPQLVFRTKPEKVKYLLLKFTQYFLPLCAAVGLCYISSYLQSFSSVPGVSVIISTLSSLLIAHLIISFFSLRTKSKLELETNTRIVENSCDVLSDIMLTLFYVIIGISSKLSDIISVGPPAIVLISVALMTHLSVLGLCSFAWNKLIRRWLPKHSSSNLTIDVDTAVIARYVYLQ